MKSKTANILLYNTEEKENVTILLGLGVQTNFCSPYKELTVLKEPLVVETVDNFIQRKIKILSCR